jgi:hypothetical protein
MLSDLFPEKKYQISLFNTSLKYLKTQLFINKAEFITYDLDYIVFCYGRDCQLSPYGLTIYTTYSYGIKLRYAYKEKFVKSNNTLISTGTKFPVIYFNYRLFSDNKNFTKKFERYEFKITKKLYGKNTGITNLTLVGGYIDGIPCYNYFYNGHGSKLNTFSIFAENTFATMDINRFMADRFIHFYFEQDFGNRFIKTKHFKPEFVISNNIGFGDVSVKELESYNKGYYEVGLQINNIINQMNIIKYGVGVFYNYGTYSNSKIISNNFAYKLTVKFNIQ